MLAACIEVGYEFVYSTVPESIDPLTSKISRGRVRVDPWDGPIEFYLKIRGRLCMAELQADVSSASSKRATPISKGVVQLHDDLGYGLTLDSGSIIGGNLGATIMLDGNLLTDRVAKIVSQSMPERTLSANIARDSDLYDAGLTSMAMVKLMLAVEVEFDIAIPDQELHPDNFRSIAAVEALIGRLSPNN